MAPRKSESRPGVRLLLGDCLDLMRKLPCGSVDAVITSPPYNKGTNNGGKSGYARSPGQTVITIPTKMDRGYRSYADDLPSSDYRAWQSEVLRESWRLLSDHGAIFYNHKPRIQGRRLETALDWNPGLPVRQIITWDPGGGINFSPTHYRPVYEWVVVFAKPGFRLMSKSASGCGDLWRIPYDRGNDHPCPFPVELVSRILRTTTARSVLDPFMGSGTTAVACLENGRDFLGMEIDPQYLADARRRVAAARRSIRTGEHEAA